MYLLYSFLSALALLLAIPWLAWHAWRHGKYSDHLRERFGWLPAALEAPQAPTIWLHAVSVGEVLSARPLVKALQAQYPGWRVVMSTTTRTGREIASARVTGLAGVFYFPLDFRWIVERVLRRLRPALLVVVETEIWPHVLGACRRHGVATVLVNARISDRSYPRYLLVRRWLARVLRDVDRCCAQSEVSADRLRTLGAPPERVIMTGSLKFDVTEDASTPIDEVLVASLVGASDPYRPILMAASTLTGEDEVMLEALRQWRAIQPDARLVLAPRHRERFGSVVRLAEATGLRVRRRSDLEINAPVWDVLVLDTIGELASVFAYADVVFVGGSLVPAGGHNILEPARHGKPIVVGPSMSNFAEIAQTFLAEGAIVQVDDAAGAIAEIRALAGDPQRRAALGHAAARVVQTRGGAVARTLQEITSVMRTRAPERPTVTEPRL